MKNEEKILKFWKENDIFHKSIEQRKDAPYFSFYDGPPFATGKAHYGHILVTAIKDAVLRYWTMRGYKVPRRVGWDCHGLPVENLIEKELGIKNKKEIEEFGVDKFNEQCRNSVFSCVDDITGVMERVGRWADYDKAYSTMDRDYTESVWWVLKQIWDKGLIKEDYRISPFCPRCSTTISNFEVNLGYKDTKTKSAYIKFKLKDDDVFLLAWTTTPWTLPQNVGLAVNKEEKYVLVKSGDEKYILSKERLEILDQEFDIEKEFKGADLVGREYTPVFNYLLKEKPENIDNAFRVFAGDFVGNEDGTGIVHIATMYGEDDYNLGKENSLPFIHTVDQNGRFFDFVEDFKGKNIFEANEKIIEFLQKKGLVFKTEIISHNYPFCWRCDSPLMYYAKESYYLMVSKIKDELIENNKQIRWVPEHIKTGRFGKWLEGARDWDFARNRFWGAPIPIWKCECGHVECIGSLEELEEKKIRGDISDLHKPKIDEVYLKCPQCGGEMKRTPEVFDCWFESGSMPYAQWHYPFENKEFVEDIFPADFITEGLDQTRGWFYTLHVIAAALTLDNIGLGKSNPAYKNVIVNGLILDANGKKLSKKLKNYPDVNEVFEKYGADALRYLLLASMASGEDYRFSEDKVKEVWRKVVFAFENCFVFWKTYKKEDKEIESKNLLDRWILSKLAHFNKEVILNMEKYELNRASRLFFDFIDDFSNWYIRRSRKRLQRPESEKEFLEAESTLAFVLRESCKIMAPFIPFITEEIYLEMKDENDHESVHLCDFPQPNEKFIDNELEEKMEKARELVTLALNERNENKIKVRQPLSSATIKSELDDELLGIIKEEINVKEILIDKNIEEEIKLDFELTDELREEGIQRELIRNIQQMRKNLKYGKNDKILLKCSQDNLSQETLQAILDEVLAEGFVQEGEMETEKTLEIYGKVFEIGIKKKI